MYRKTELQDAVYEWIKGLPRGKCFEHTDAYRFLEANFEAECNERGDADNEPRHKNDARWAVQDALGQRHRKQKAKIVEQVSRGVFRRL